jgi:flagellar L-ring protein precursor FlgH
MTRLLSARNPSSLAVLLGACLLTSALLAERGSARKTAGKSTPPDVALTSYVERVRAASAAETHTPGSIWLETGRLTRLPIDVKALHPHDLISIVVSESLAASTDGAVKNSRSSSASSAITSLMGKLSAANNLQNLVNQNSSAALSAQGQSVSNSSLSTTLGGEVIDVMPNGAMIIQAVRQLTFAQQTQVIRVRGVIRPDDVNAQNQVLSTAITNMEVEVVGKGIINDYTYRPNALVRLLQRLVIF